MARIVKDPDVRRGELIATAQHLFYSKGYECTSVNDIVNQVGVAKGTFYHYFDSKTAVLLAVVDEVVGQTLSILQAVVADETLTAISKWKQAMQTTNNWKLERKEEMLEVSRLLMMEENVLLQHRLRTELSKTVAGELAKIIAQGVEEGVFDTQLIEETAEIAITIITSLSDTMHDLIFNPGKYDDPATLAQRKNVAVQTAVERLLGAPAGSMPIIDEKTLMAWFTD